ncbi:MAG: hypothetical protein Q8P50_12320 [Bacillota bacterium]|nr:hypothetical protein [Bacillota bacterium]
MRLYIWVAALLTLAIFSFLYKENPVYRAAEHLFVGVAAGNGVVMAVDSYLRPTVKSVFGGGQPLYIIPLCIGLLMYTKFVRPVAWMSRITIAFLVGIGSGIALTRQIKPFFVDQIVATIQPLYIPGNLGLTINNILLVTGVATSLSYFYFTAEQKGALGYSAKLGRYTMMIAFGAAFGNTVMSRISLFLGRVQFLMKDWLGVLR